MDKKQKAKVAQRLRQAMRQLFSTSQYRSEALKAAPKKQEKINNRKRVLYQCNSCKEYFPLNEVEVDHLTELPRANYDDITKVDWNAHVKALFVDADGLQVLCTRCHKMKTFLYNTRTK